MPTINGTARTDTLHGTRNADILFGHGADDIIFGGQERDPLKAARINDGNDRAYGGPGSDIIYTGGGNDWASGGGNRDKLYMGLGNDNAYAGEGDRVNPGPGTPGPLGDRDVIHILGNGKPDRPGGEDNVFIYNLDWDRDHIDFHDDRKVKIVSINKRGIYLTDGDTDVNGLWNYSHGSDIPLGDTSWTDNLIV
jgi:hypothetical protein